jgi:outer membrane protein TolC
MNMRTLVTLTLLALAAPALADQPVPLEGRALTLTDALDLARRNNRDLLAARARYDQAAVGIEQAWVALLPQLVTQGKYTHNYKEVVVTFGPDETVILASTIQRASGNAQLNGALNEFKQEVAALTPAPVVIQKEEQLDYLIALTVPLVVPWAYPALTSAKRSAAAAAANYDVTTASLLQTTAQAFYAAAGTDEILIARQHAIEVARQTRDNAKARLEAGVVNRVEVTRAEIALLRAEQAAREAIDSRVQAYRSLATMILIREPFHVVTDEEVATTQIPADDLAKSALTLRPEFVAYQRNVEAAAELVSSAKWRWAPTLSGFGNARAFNYGGFSGNDYSWALGLQLDWTLYDGGLRDYQRHLAQAQRRENELRLAQLRDTVVDEVVVARRSLETKRLALETARRSVDLSKETLELVRVQHDAGTATQLDLLQAQDALVGAEVAVAQARFDLALSDVALRRAAGLFPGK